MNNGNKCTKQFATTKRVLILVGRLKEKQTVIITPQIACSVYLILE